MKQRVFFFSALLLLAATRNSFGIGGVDKPPSPSAPHEITFGQPKEARLENGLRVIVVERPGLPLLAAQLVVRTGSEADPVGRAGAASMTGSLLIKGTEKMSAPEIASAIESLGGEIDSGARWDASNATLIIMSTNAEPALAILADVVLHPAFKQEEIDRLKAQTLDGLRVMLQQPGSLARFVIDRVIYGTSEYGHAASGTMETVEAIERDDLVKLYRTYYAPDNAALILVGDITIEQGRGYAQKFFGDWKADAEAAKERAPSQPIKSERQDIVIDMPEVGQASVNVAELSIQRDSPDYYTGLVANAALGSGFVSRLNREIRIKRGLSYGARSAIDARRNGGSFVATAQTKNPSAAEVANLLIAELKGLRTKPVEGDELKSRQAVLTGAFARNLETNRGIGAQVVALVVYDRPLDSVNLFIPRINAITAEDVTAFAEKYFDAKPSLIVAGKASEFIESMKKEFPEVRVIPQKDLDLNSADLVKAKAEAER